MVRRPGALRATRLPPLQNPRVVTAVSADVALVVVNVIQVLLIAGVVVVIVWAWWRG